jgi:rod shape-determining protein MreD
MSPAPEQNYAFLLPAQPPFIAASLFVALLLNWLPWSGVWLMLAPDFLALTLLFWCTHKPQYVGIGVAWCVGILSDVATGSLLGQHALAYAVLAYGGDLLNRRIQMFDLYQQTLQVFPLLLSCYTAYAAVHWWLHGFVAWGYFLGALTTALFWMPLSLLLQYLSRTRKARHPL